jgi:hypothetical protein
METLQTEDAFEESESVTRSTVADFFFGIRKAFPVLLLLAGMVLMLTGAIIVSLTEEPAHSTVIVDKENVAAAKEDHGWLTPGWRSLIRFSADFFGVRIGELLVIGWFLETMLHTDHYGTFFLNQIERAMSGERFAQRWSKSPTLWKKVSEVYFDDRFPEIKDDLTDTLYEYFPTEHEFYLSDYEYRIRLTLADGYVTSDEEISYKCVPKKGGTPVPFKLFNAVYRTSENDTETSAEVLGVSINRQAVDDDFAFKPAQHDGRPILLMDVSREKVCDGRYDASVRLMKRWNIAVDPYKNFSVQSLVHNLKVIVEHSENLELEWVDVGVLSGFEDTFGPEGSGNHRIEKQYKGLLFKNQGFRITMRERKKPMAITTDIVKG